MSDRGDSGQGSGEDQNAQGANSGGENSGEQGSEEFRLSKTDYEALSKKIEDLERDNYRYRQERRQSSGGSSTNAHSNNGVANTASNAGEGAANTSGEVAALREKIRVTNFRASIADEGSKFGLANSATLTRVMKMDGYVDDEGNIEDPKTFFEDAKLLYPALFKETAAPPPIDGGAGGKKPNGNESFSDQLRRELKSRT